MDRKAFGSDVKTSASFTDWRKDGKVIFFVHPESEIEKRTMITLSRIVENSDDEEEIRGIRRFYQGDADITRQFLLWLKNDATDIDSDEVVFRLKTAGGDVQEWLKGDLLNMKGYDWRKNMLRPRTEYLFCIINVTEKGEPPKGPEVLVLPFSAGKKLNAVWDGEIEENGEVEGDPFVTPYACKVTFDSAERGTDMYSASAVIKRKLTEAARKLFDEDPVDLSQYTDPDSEQDKDAGTTLDLLRAMCVVPCPLLETDVEVETVADDGEKKASEKTAKKAKTTKKAVKKTEKKSSKKVVKKKEKAEAEDKPQPPSKPTPIQTGVIPAEEGIPGNKYLYDDEEVVFVKYNRKKGKAIVEDEDGRIRISGDAELTVVPNEGGEESNADAEQTVNNSDTITPENCERGAVYITEAGAHVTFLRFNATKKKGVFKDEDDERIFLPEDAILSALGDDEKDPLSVRKKPTQQTAPAQKVTDTDDDGDNDDDDMEPCPLPECGKLISSDSTECPHCGSQFEDDDDIPF
jgi:hypothetical protein